MSPATGAAATEAPQQVSNVWLHATIMHMLVMGVLNLFMANGPIT